MRRPIRWFATLLLIVALVSVAGCGKKSPDTSGTPTTPSTGAPASAVNPGNEIAALLAKGAAIKNMSFEGTLSSAGVGYDLKGWVLGGKSRIERIIGENATITIYDADTKASWTWVKGAADGFKGDLGTVMESPIFWAQTLQGAPWKKADTGTVNGVKCRVVGFAYGTTDGSVNTTLWVAEDSGAPIKMQSSWNGIEMSFEYKNISTAAPAADLFVPPTNVKFAEIPK